MQDYTYTTTSNVSGADAGSFLLMTLVFSVVIYLVYAFILSKVFVKAGRPAWAAYVPIYSSWVLFEIAGKPGWWLLLLFVPFVNVIVGILVMLALAEAFGNVPRPRQERRHSSPNHPRWQCAQHPAFARAPSTRRARASCCGCLRAGRTSCQRVRRDWGASLNTSKRRDLSCGPSGLPRPSL